MKLKNFTVFLGIFLIFILAGCQSESGQHQNHLEHTDHSEHMDHTEELSESTENLLGQKEEVHQQGYGLFNVSSLHEDGLKGENVKIAVLDTGIDLEHKDLKVIASQNFVDEENLDDPSAADVNGHGTKISGIIGAKENNFGLLGIAPNSDLYVGKVSNDLGYAKSSDLIKGIQWAIEQKVDIINISLEFYEDNPDLHKVIKEAYNNNIIMVASSGNQDDPNKERKVAFPAAYEEVISVGMLDEEGKLSENGFEDSKIDVYGPGEDIASTFLDDKLTLDTGASFATAYISGYVALLIQNNKESETSYNQETIITALQDNFHQYMGNSILETAFFVTSIIAGLLILGLFVYIIINLLFNRKIFKDKKMIKNLTLVGSIGLIFFIVSLVIPIVMG
ncbi:hypothetical protein CJ195_24535 [Bacillus sp. UMB0899]|uniref:S8 family peptidase n=1 Tax=Metabacillus schmidteae TaxID=2730405 RepID=UPI000C8000E7|nr:S8 family peptidase [Metabacillus schmidteae]PMC34129.1 hypothetical protein CJ195_24535 [Bacillus sp. UMB0899]